MSQLKQAVFALSAQVSPEKLEIVIGKILELDQRLSGKAPTSWFSTPVARSLFDEVVRQWQLTDVSPQQLAGMIQGASYAYDQAKKEVKTELIWTGPTTPIVSTRRTEQALLEVIDSASSSLFMTSFVAYKVPSIVAGIKSAISRGVEVSMLLESSDQHGGNISVDAIGNLRELLPGITLYHWADKSGDFEGAKVHAKVAVSDQAKCFISSANLTGHAMEKNMEAGVVIQGGDVPSTLYKHLEALVTTRVICRI
ncbi:MAG: DISARM system phospholipase D-like protein DrmC [Candidatus Pelagadaptatus aseana]|uniref:DISARM system phospholipase D-like protein DrmC n=1 Tax=Candidatus Pelagadaptatus aseana TaxID=3120508 RepID=UPI0039B31CDE